MALGVTVGVADGDTDGLGLTDALADADADGATVGDAVGVTAVGVAVASGDFVS